MKGKKGYAELLKRKEWHDFRQRCLEAAGYACINCKRTQKETSLHIHHPHYANLLPWEYEIEFCEVLCAGCHAEVHGLKKPSDGWILIHSDWDEGESSGETRCEHCDTAMEWHNDLYHPDWGVIVVGYDCAEKLCDKSVHLFAKYNRKRETFIRSPLWKRTPKGWRYKLGDVETFILDKGNAFVANARGVWMKEISSLPLAKTALFSRLFPAP